MMPLQKKHAGRINLWLICMGLLFAPLAMGELSIKGKTNTKGMSPPGKPGKPRASGNLTDKVRVTWRRVRGATGYKIYRCNQPRTTSDCAAGIAYPLPPYDDVAARGGVFYYYRVAACNPAGCSAMSAADKGRKAVARPPAPRQPGATNNTPAPAIIVTWGPLNDVSRYEVYRCSSTSFSSCTMHFDTNQPPYVDNQTVAGRTYYYRIKACDEEVCSQFSPPAMGKRRHPVAAVPGNVRITVQQGASKVLWNQTPYAQRYEIRRCDLAANRCDSSIRSLVPRYIDTEVRQGHKYSYEVRSCNQGGCSAYSPKKIAMFLFQ